MLIHRATLSHQCPLFDAVGNSEFGGTLTLLKQCAGTVLMLFRSCPCSGPQPGSPCPALPLRAVVASGVRAVPLTPPVSGPLCARPNRCATASRSAWGFALCLGGLTAKTPFQPKGRPFSPLAGNDFIPTACSNSLLFCLKLSEHCLLLPFSLPPRTPFYAFKAGRARIALPQRAHISLQVIQSN